MIAETVARSAESQILAIVGAALVIFLAGLFFRWVKRHIAEPLRDVPVIAQKLDRVGEQVDILTHTLTFNGNTSDPPTILDRLQNVEVAAGVIKQGQTNIKSHLTRQDTKAVATAAEVAQTVLDTASHLDDKK